MPQNPLAQSVSIVIPTYQRPNWVRRLLGALHTLDFGGHVIVADSSTAENLDQTKRDIATRDHGFRISHLSVPKGSSDTISKSLNEAISVGSECVDTPYAMWTCDDDLPIPQGIDACARLLDKDDSLVSAVGDFTRLDLTGGANKSTTDYVPFKTKIALQASNAIPQTTGAERYNYFTNYFFASLFSVMRADVMRRVVPPICYEITYPYFAAEFIWHYTVAIAGRGAQIDVPHLIRQRHDQAYAELQNRGEIALYPDYVEAMLSPTWTDDANKFVDYIASLIADSDNIPIDKAKAIALKGFSELSVRRLQWTGQKEYYRTDRYKKRRKVYNNPRSAERKTLERAIDALLAVDV